jgi:hypothetical protein
MKNNKLNFSPMAALGSGAICFTTFGMSLAPLLFPDHMTRNNTTVFVPMSEGTEYSVSYSHAAVTFKLPVPEIEASDSDLPDEEVFAHTAEPVPGDVLVPSAPELDTVTDPESSEVIPNPAPELEAQPAPEAEQIIQSEPEALPEPEPASEPEPEPEMIETDILEAIVEAPVENPGCPDDLRIDILDSNTWYVHRDIVEYYAARPFQIKEIAGTWRSRDDDGNPIGFKVRPTECSVLFEAGFLADDIVTSINGRTVTSMLEGISAYFALRRDEVFDVRIIRDDEEVALTFHLEEETRDDRRRTRRDRRRLRRMSRNADVVVDAQE